MNTELAIWTIGTIFLLVIILNVISPPQIESDEYENFYEEEKKEIIELKVEKPKRKYKKRNTSKKRKEDVLK